MEKETENIGRLLELKFLHRQSAFAKIVAEETRLRREFSRLDDMVKQANARDYGHIRALGADVIWNKWVEKTKSSLNQELALVLAQKEKMLGSIRREYGKIVAMKEVASALELSRRRDTNKRRLTKIIEQHHLQDR